MNLTISTYCTIYNKKVFLNGEQLHEDLAGEEDFLKALYKKLEIDYSKFYKMDGISRLGLLGVELLKTANHGLLNCEDDEVAMVFQSENGCLESDVNHQLEVNKKSPSPAVFVYTLSNIVIGEISIRNKWYGESIFFIDNFDSNKNLLSYSKSLLLSGKAKKIIAAKIEHFDENVFLSCALIDEEGSMPLTDENLKKVLNTK